MSGRGKRRKGRKNKAPCPPLPPAVLKRILDFVASHVIKEYNYFNESFYGDYEGNDKYYVASCSAVSRAWHQAALPHLFYTLAAHIDPRHEGRRTFNLEKGNSARSLTEILEGINTLPVFREYTKEIRLRRDPMIEEFTGKWATADSRLVARIIYSLPHLRVIDLVDLEFPRVDPATITAIAPSTGKKSVERFRFMTGVPQPDEHGWTWALALEPLVGLINCFTDIGELFLDGVCWVPVDDEGSHDVPATMAFTANLHTIKMRSSFTKEITECLEHSADTVLRQIHSLDLCCIGELCIESANNALQKLGGHLVHLLLCVTELLKYNTKDYHPRRRDKTNVPLLHLVNISPCIGLESLTIQWNAVEGGMRLANSQICEYLTSFARTPHLKRLGLSILIVCERKKMRSMLKREDTVELERTLLASLSPRAKVVLDFPWQSEEQDYSEMMKRACAALFPTLHRAGMLEPGVGERVCTPVTIE